MSKLGKYIRTYGRPFTLRKTNGKGVIEVRFNDGYVTIYSRQPGTSKFEQEIHITRKAWYALLNSPQLKNVSRQMKGPSFDCYKAQRKDAKAERAHLEEMRRQKVLRRGSNRRRRVARLRAKRGQA